MEWYMAWLNATVWACFLPVIMVGAVFGVGDPSLVQSWRFGASSPDDPKGAELIVGAYSLLLKSTIGLMMLAIWPAMTGIMYGGKILEFNEHQFGNLIFLGLVGYCVGMWAALKLLTMIDEYFGVDPSRGISCAVRVYGFVGQAYVATKVVKGAGSIIRKI
jgi:hypothetical protein